MHSTPIKLLIVDDNSTACGILQDYFHCNDDISICGFADNGINALEMIQIHRPDVVLLDLIMPRLDGLSVLEQLDNAPFPHRPAVIVASALGTEAITQRSLQLGANYYLIKPYPLEDLSERIFMIMKPKSIFTNRPVVEVDPGIAVTRHLINIGMSTHIVGYHYCAQAISLLLAEPAYCPLMKIVYPTVADNNDTSVPCVESAIRKAISSVRDPQWNHLSNRSFLSRMTEQIRLNCHIPTPLSKGTINESQQKRTD